MTDDVSRETPPPPPVAAGVFAATLPVVTEFAGILASDGTERGVIGPREVPRLWERHLLNCAVITELMGEGASVADVGSGAGLPGLVVAIRRPDLRVTLIEPLARRTRFLDEVVEALALPNVEVVRGRAEQIANQRRFDVVTSRAVARLPQLMEWSLPLVAPGGAMVAMKGRSAAEEVAELDDVGIPRGAAEPEIITIGETTLPFPTTVIRVKVSQAIALDSVKRSPSRGRRTKKKR